MKSKFSVSFILSFFFFIINYIDPIVGPPIVKTASSKKPSLVKEPDRAVKDLEIINSKQFKNLHYKEYVTQVLQELETDEGFKSKLEKASSDNYTHHLVSGFDLLSHKVRGKLDELKLREVNRLNDLYAEYQRRLAEEKGDASASKSAAGDVKLGPHLTDEQLAELAKIYSIHHVNHENPAKFDSTDLRKLIDAVAKDLRKVDEAEEAEHKRHTIDKELKKRRSLKNAKTQAERDAIVREDKEKQRRHRDHEKLSQPGSVDEMKEVWRNTDHMDPENYDPKLFFKLHDVNGDGHLDVMELEAIQLAVLKKVYESNNPDDDIEDEKEEAMRMRQEMMRVMDKDNNQMISLEEFVNYQNSEKAKEHKEWKPADEDDEPDFSEEELKEAEEEEEKENQEHHKNEGGPEKHLESADSHLKVAAAAAPAGSATPHPPPEASTVGKHV